MRSVRYILTGRPHKTDDCLSLARRLPPRQVTLTLDADQFLTDQSIVVELVARCEWDFPGRAAASRHVCGGFNLPDETGAIRRSIWAANLALERMLARLAAAGISVIGADQRFDEASLAVLQAAGN